MSAAWDAVVTAVGVAGTGTTKVSTLTAGIKSAVHDQVDAKAAEYMKAQGFKSLDAILDDIIASNATLKTALGI